MSNQTKENLKTLKEADSVQDKTLAALERAQRLATETEQIGVETFDELNKQGDQMDEVNSEIDRINAKLETSSVLQKNFQRWAGNWFGGSGESTAAIRDRMKEEYFKIKEVYEDQKFDNIFRSWKPHGLVQCADPEKECTDLFDPEIVAKMENSSWIVDYSQTEIDKDGWTYAFDFSSLNKEGTGEASPHLNSFVRRRKWRYAHAEGAILGGDSMDNLVTRNDERKISNASNHKPIEGVGYVPRERQSSIKDTGLTNAGMMDSPEREKLDEASAAGLAHLKEKDAKIDAGIDRLDNTIDNIAAISSAMKHEVAHQHDKIDHLAGDVHSTSEKHRDINARQRHILNSN